MDVDEEDVVVDEEGEMVVDEEADQEAMAFAKEDGMMSEDEAESEDLGEDADDDDDQRSEAGEQQAATDTTTATGKEKQQRQRNQSPEEQQVKDDSQGQQEEGEAKEGDQHKAKVEGEEAAAEEEDLVGSDVVVFQPDTFHLVFGRASDGLPIVERHAIAYRNKPTTASSADSHHGTTQGQQPPAVRQPQPAAAFGGFGQPAPTAADTAHGHEQGIFAYEDPAVDMEQREQALAAVQAEMKMVRDTRGRRLPGSNALVDENRLRKAQQGPRKPTTIAAQNDRDSVFEDVAPVGVNKIVGHQVTHLKRDSNFTVFHPLLPLGDLDCRTRSRTAVEDSMADIWRELLQHHLSLRPAALRRMRAVVLVPDLASRAFVRSVVRVVLDLLGFQSVLVHHDSVCATFGAGLPGACVVNLHARNTSVSCVQDGVVIGETRMQLPYGLFDVARTAGWLMERVYFHDQPSPISYRSVHDMESLLRFNDDNLHFVLPEASQKPHTLTLRYPCEHTLKYHIVLAQQVVFAPYGLFYPVLLGLDPTAATAYTVANGDDPEDAVVDDNRPNQSTTTANNTSSTPTGSTTPVPAGTGSPPKRAKLSRRSTARSRSAANDVASPSTSTAATPQQPPPSRIRGRNSSTSGGGGSGGGVVTPVPVKGGVAAAPAPAHATPMLPLDRAVVQSILGVPSLGVRGKMWQAIILTGSGAKYRNFANTLQQRLFMVMSELKLAVDDIVVLDKAKDIDPAHLTWKGGAILAQLQAADEMWVTQDVWQRLGTRALREVFPFEW
ncbi:hypothetical protein PTSG_04175 [Salpingoeca rosetta]|uniref:Actin-related protein 8 n=1 Tax=Salpingoeca rosetta (strain ATCC 50818 / BSB-021) TaxID=946362 RepID=F2U6T7_SALR5|nr:uncharacterized protein PTSG_04175 [Salpingoeca rosetta]EGD83569.1 hypothetical protein PTSG_04175 [Salpingoeca rosetta]|eukprot:XP_004995073.1 hypothetical protein PTSG_04175 [Salpingoeca rosetta]